MNIHNSTPKANYSGQCNVNLILTVARNVVNGIPFIRMSTGSGPGVACKSHTIIVDVPSISTEKELTRGDES